MSFLRSINACQDGAKWADSQGSYREAWNLCERGDWMLWIAIMQGVDLRVITKAKVECAKLVEHLMKGERSLNALRVSERFADGTATRGELAAAYAAAYADAYADATYADAAAYAADAGAAAYAADAAAYAADAATYAADAAARTETLKMCADICRKYIKFEDLNID